MYQYIGTYSLLALEDGSFYVVQMASWQRSQNHIESFEERLRKKSACIIPLTIQFSDVSLCQ